MHMPAVWLSILIALAALPVAAQDAPPGWRYGPGPMGHGGWALMMFFGPLMMILFVAAVVVLVAFAFWWVGGHGPHGVGHAPTPMGKAPIDILKERFARGEIDKTAAARGARGGARDGQGAQATTVFGPGRGLPQEGGGPARSLGSRGRPRGPRGAPGAG